VKVAARITRETVARHPARYAPSSTRHGRKTILAGEYKGEPLAFQSRSPVAMLTRPIRTSLALPRDNLKDVLTSFDRDMDTSGLALSWRRLSLALDGSKVLASNMLFLSTVSHNQPRSKSVGPRKTDPCTRRVPQFRRFWRLWLFIESVS